MRWKIIAVNAIIILLVGVGSFGLLMSSLNGLVSDPVARKQAVSQALRAATAQLALDASKLERWLEGRVNQGALAKVVFSAGTEVARQEAATAQANQLMEAVVGDPSLDKITPSLTLFTDEHGVVLGRNGSALMRGEKLGDIYPGIKQVLRGAGAASELWFNRARNEQLLVSYASVRSPEDGSVLGAAVVGLPLNDERLLRTSSLTSGLSLAAAVPGENALELVAHSGSDAREIMASASSAQVLRAAKAAVSGGLNIAEGAVQGYVYGASPLRGYGPGALVLLAATPVSLAPDFSLQVGGPILGITMLGLGLVVAGGFLLGNYISRPISELEDGLLSIMNGNGELRFQIEHAELGGLVFRINSLLNTLMGVAEDTTDDEGRPSQAPSAKAFGDALSVDESSVLSQQVDPEVARVLAAEPAAQYYARLHREYVNAKRQLGDPVEHITFDSFTAKIQESEGQMAQKHGRNVRFQVILRDNAVVLVAVPVP